MTMTGPHLGAQGVHSKAAEGLASLCHLASASTLRQPWCSKRRSWATSCSIHQLTSASLDAPFAYEISPSRVVVRQNRQMRRVLPASRSAARWSFAKRNEMRTRQWQHGHWEQASLSRPRG